MRPRRGNRFCTKLIKDTDTPRCGVASHAAHKADLKQDHGCTPRSANDHSNTESAFVSSTLSGRHFPSSIDDLAGQALSHEEWVTFLVRLPAREVMEESSEVEVEMAAKALKRSKLLVSFAVAPAKQKPGLPLLVSQIMKTKSALNLESRFDKENDTSADKIGLLTFDDLEAPPICQDGAAAKTTGAQLFAPLVAQWNSLVSRVETLTSELGTAREALAAVADVLEDRFDAVDRQVTNRRRSI